MSMANLAEEALLDLLFLNIDFANIGNAGGLRGSTLAGQFFVALHTQDPGETGNAQTTYETTLGGIIRVGINRAAGAGGFVRSGSTISNVSQVTFAEVTSGTETITHYSIGMASAGAGQILYRAQLIAPRTFSTGFTPIFNAGALSGTMD